MEVEMGARIRPYWGRVAVIDSPADESERPSGIVVPVKYDGDEGIIRGVVVDVDRTDDDFADRLDLLEAGAVVYYDQSSGRKIGGTRIVSPGEILAFEAPEDDQSHGR